MSQFTLFVGTKNLSSWSLRAWLVMKYANVDFNTVVIKLDQSDTKDRLTKLSPSKKVPVLQHNNHLIWDSLAIAEYMAELFPEKNFWPIDPIQRSIARSIACEMHSGFFELRKNLSMNLNKKFKNYNISPETELDIQRIIQIWETHLSQKSSQFLFGNYTIADIMFAPVATRFVTYDVKLPKFAQNYVEKIISMPAMKEWYTDAMNDDIN